VAWARFYRVEDTVEEDQRGLAQPREGKMLDLIKAILEIVKTVVEIVLKLLLIYLAIRGLG
jgi:hypothetical protein